MTFLANRRLPQADPPRPAHETLPTMYDLPSEFPEEPGLPDEFHDLQPQLLSRTLSLTNYSNSERFTGSDINLYYDVHHRLWHKRPDWFFAVNVPRVYQSEEGEEARRSYVVWQEGKSPSVVVEFISPRTEKEDLGRFYEEADRIPEARSEDDEQSSESIVDRSSPPSKLKVYEEYLSVPHYIVYSRYTRRLRYFKLIGGRYEEQPVQAGSPKIWLSELEIGLGLWDDYFDGLPGPWLRWCDAQGDWFLTDIERERLAKEEAQSRAQKLAEKLKELGVDPDSL